MIDGVRKYMQNGDQVQFSMQELDETVASLGESCENVHSLTPTRRRREVTAEEVRTPSSLCNVSSVMPQHAQVLASTNSQLIDNIDTVKCKSHFSRISSSSSKKSIGTKGSRFSRSISSRSSRRRGASLERSISQVILQTAVSSSSEASGDVSDNETVVSTDDILKDLIQADAVWAAEIGSAFNLLPPIETEDETELLPPILIQASRTPDEWQPKFDNLSFHPASRHPLCTPIDEDKRDINAPDVTPRLAALKKPSKTEETYLKAIDVYNVTVEPVAIIQRNDEALYSLFGDDPFGNVHFSSSISKSPSFGQNGDDEENDWIPFDDNPFHDDTRSLDSPSSVADFSRVVDRVPTHKSESWLGVSTKGSF